MIKITFNGEQKRFDSAINLLELVELYSLKISNVAIEKNGVIVQRSQYCNTLIEDGDIIECFEFVGGG